MTTTTSDAVISFVIQNTPYPTHIDHTHPVPTFLTQPSDSQQGSAEFVTAFVDTVSIITGMHHEECIAAITSPCMNCGGKAKDALKSPSNLLSLAQPTIVVKVTPVCGSTACESKVRAYLLHTQKEESDAASKGGGTIYGKMNCAVCGKEDGKRCAGCGTVAYCGKECQTQHWEEHKRWCHRGRKLKDKKETGMTFPFETI
ncbi:hypothetical protein MMC28_004091 [Mycoblastus sanguinarius]|nr:hypothetical protein [Mycoblastus sanguinarius]